MNSITSTDASRDTSAPRAPSASSLPWRPVMAGLTCLLACGLASQGGAVAVSASFAGALATAWWARETRRPGATDWNESERAQGSAPLVKAVVPAWRAQVDLARQQSEGSVEGMLGHFSQLADHLNQAVGTSSGQLPEDSRDFVEGVLLRNEDQLNALSDPLSQAVQTKRQTQAGLLEFAQAMGELSKLAREVKSLARSTNLVAVNAAIEANRAGTEGYSFAIVADEVRRLASQSGSTGDQIVARISAIERAMEDLQSRVGTELESDDAALLAARHAARRVVMKVLESASQMADSSRALRDVGREVHQKIEELMIGMQHQDRFSQMLASVTRDMERFDDWLAAGEMSSPAHAAEWLDRLAASYTTQEQRHEHHGTTTVHTSGGVDFF